MNQTSKGAEAGSTGGEDLEEALMAAVGGIESLNFATITSPMAAVAVGWLRAAADQVRIMLATSRDDAPALAPNRRLVFEIVLRMAWLAEEGQTAFDGLTHAEQDDLRRFENRFGPEAFQNSLPTVAALVNPGSGSASNKYPVAHYAEHRGLQRSVYLAWWWETQSAHAGIPLARRYVAFDAGNARLVTPPPTDPVTEALAHQIAYILRAASDVLTSTGHTEVGTKVVELAAELEVAVP